MKTVEEVKSRLICLVPKKEAIKANSMLLSSHERTLCDCQVLEVIQTLESRLEEYRKLLERAIESLKHLTDWGYAEDNILADYNALMEKNNGKT